MRTIFRLDNPVKDHAWGSYGGISACTGAPVPVGKRAAELWMGAHPSFPSIAEGVRLDTRIAADVAAMTGAAAFASGATLPFLFKVLSAGEPLSIQAHPSRATAREGYARENASGIPLDSPLRTYRDDNHKPELAVALSPFTALCGFRPLAETLDLMGPALSGALLGALAGSRRISPVDLVERLLAPARFPDRASAERLQELALSRAESLAQAGSPSRTDPAHKPDPAPRLVPLLARLYPLDPGVLMPFILNALVLEPGEGIYLPAGVLHAYMEGTCLELMANSDNVIRGGLTPKHVDTAELLRVLREREAEESRTGTTGMQLLHPVREGAAEIWKTPAREFELSRIRRVPSVGSAGIPPVTIVPRGPEILLCTEGSFNIEVASAESHALERGQSVFIAAACPGYRVTGAGTLWRAGEPDSASAPDRATATEPGA